MTVAPAETTHPILDVLAERWSTRVFDATAELDEAAFASALQAARWAPSASNTQPWRFIVGRRGTATHRTLVESLAGFNQTWAGDASALVAVVTETIAEDGAPRPWGVYDAGQAAAHFTVQAHAGGLFTHQMGGFDRAAISTAFELGDHLTPITIIAVGAYGDVTTADPALVEREVKPRTRRDISDSIIAED